MAAGLCPSALFKFVDKPQQGDVYNCSYSLRYTSKSLRPKSNVDRSLLASVRYLCAQLLNIGLIEAGLALEDIANSHYLLKEDIFVREPGKDYGNSDSEIKSSCIKGADLKALTAGSTVSPEAALLLKSLQLLNLLAGEDVTLYQAAEILRISIDTANKHVAKIKSNFGVVTLPAAILYAAEEGLIKRSID